MLIGSALVSGIGLGSMYGLLALGYHVTYAASGTVNFAQGATMMLCAVLSFSFWVTFGWPLAAALIVALAATSLWGVFVERVAVQPFVRRGSSAWLMATVALGIVLENVVLFTFGKDPRGWPTTVLTSQAIELFGVKTQLLQIAIPAAGLGLAIIIHLVLRHTRYGKALLAVVQNREAAGLMGISAERMVSVAYATSSLLAGVAGILVAPLFTISPHMGTLFGIKAFAAAMLGGIGNAWGVFLAGVLYGIAEALIIALFGSTYSQIAAFALVIVALTIAPHGLFGRASVRKV
jgi:branched-chain amino acid transport system permease protein